MHMHGPRRPIHTHTCVHTHTRIQEGLIAVTDKLNALVPLAPTAFAPMDLLPALASSRAPSASASSLAPTARPVDDDHAGGGGGGAGGGNVRWAEPSRPGSGLGGASESGHLAGGGADAGGCGVKML